MEGFGPEKLIFILLIMILVFGAKRLPEIGSSLGKGIREFKKSVSGADELVPPPTQQGQILQAQVPAALPTSAAAAAAQSVPVPGVTTQA